MDKKTMALDFPYLGSVFRGIYEPRFFPVSENSDFCCGRHSRLHASCPCARNQSPSKRSHSSFPGCEVLRVGFERLTSNLVPNYYDVFTAHAVFGRRMVRLGGHDIPCHPYPLGPLVSSPHLPTSRQSSAQDLGRAFNAELPFWCSFSWHDWSVLPLFLALSRDSFLSMASSSQKAVATPFIWSICAEFYSVYGEFFSNHLFSLSFGLHLARKGRIL